MRPPASPIRVLMIDDHALVRAGLRMLIESRPRYQVVGEAGNRNDALALVASTPADIVLLDLDLGGESAIDVLKELKAAAAGARLLVLTGVRDLEIHRHAIRLGASGVLLKDKAADLLLKAIERVHDGELWVDRALAGGLITELTSAGGRNAEQQKIDTLTPREREVVALVAQGLRNKDIADRLFISSTTVRHHLTAIFSKLDVTDRLALVIYAFRHHLADLPK